MASSQGGKGGRKIGRDRSSARNLRYKAEGRMEKNKIRRAKKHAKQHPNDKTVYRG